MMQLLYNYRKVWELTTTLDDQEEQLFRYCVVVILEPLCLGNPRRIIVRRWETHQLPRKITKCQDQPEDLDIFGVVDRVQRVQRGWLTDEMVIQFKLSGGGMTIYKKKYSEHRLWVKLTPLVKEWGHSQGEELSQTDDSIDMQDVRNRSGSWPIVEAAVSLASLLFDAQSKQSLAFTSTLDCGLVRLLIQNTLAGNDRD